jgi:hypothetical protein
MEGALSLAYLYIYHSLDRPPKNAKQKSHTKKDLIVHGSIEYRLLCV